MNFWIPQSFSTPLRISYNGYRMLLGIFSWGFRLGGEPILEHLSVSSLYSPQVPSMDGPIMDFKKSIKVSDSFLHSVFANSRLKQLSNSWYSQQTSGILRFSSARLIPTNVSIILVIHWFTFFWCLLMHLDALKSPGSCFWAAFELLQNFLIEFRFE